MYMQKTLLSDILTYPVATIAPDNDVQAALSLMRKQRISSLVVTEDDRPLGIFTERDAVFLSHHRQSIEAINVAEVMGAPPLTAPAEMDYRDGYRLITENQVRHLIVVDEAGALTGIITEGDFLAHLSSEFLVRFKEVGALMTREVLTLPTDGSTDDAVRLMANERTSCVVVEEDGRPAGIFTERDLIRLDSARGEISSVPLATVMSRPVHTVHIDTPLPEALQDMDDLGFRRLVVVDKQNSIAGLLTRHDVVKQLYDRHLGHLQETLDRREQELEEVRAQLEAERKLQRSEERLAESQRLAKIGSWELDLINNELWWSDEAFSIFEIDPKKFGASYEAFLDTIHPDDRELVNRTYTESVTNRTPYDLVHRLLFKNGRIKYVNEHCKTFYDDKGKAIRSIGTVQDITEQKQTQEQLAHAEAEWTQAMDQFDQAVYLLDMQRRLLRANKAFYRMIGSDPEHSLGRDIADLVHPEGEDDLCPVCKAQHELREGTIVIEADNPNNPVKQPIEATFKLVRDAADNPTAMLVSVSDLSHSRQIDERLRLSASVFENTAEGIFVTDADGNIIETNPAFTDITGYTRKEVIGCNPRIFQSGRHGRGFYQEMWQTLSESGRWRGEIWNRRKDGAIFPQWQNISAVHDNQRKITHYVSVFSDISQIKESQEKLDHLAYHDALTDLPNRLLLSERLEQAIRHAERHRSQLAVIFMDLDNFKHINDSLGHMQGDRLLQEVSTFLFNAVRQDDTVARVGGDEFVLVLEDVGEPEHVGVIAQKLLSSLDQPILLDGHEVNVTASLGICLYPRDGKDAGTLLRNADAAMYRAKEEGRNTYHFYTEELTRNAFERVLLENSLRQALDKDELTLYYQIQLDLHSNRIVGAEALIRWNHPQLGLVSPAKFITIAEDSGLIIPIGNWVLKEACAQTKRWLDRGIDIGRIAVNIAGAQIKRGGLIEGVTDALNAAGLPANRLELEVSEGFIMQQAESAIRQLHELRLLGVALAIDDFGTGYSSLSYLKQLPIHKLKIDQSFVRDVPDDPNDTAISDAIIAMGRSLGLTVIAEGVEKPEQVTFLKMAGCQEAQGFLFSKPVPAEQFEKLILDHYR
jgi:diguanylate cyclase (GGDEF)-like protein/PAS domain S-box-containing protein